MVTATVTVTVTVTVAAASSSLSGSCASWICATPACLACPSSCSFDGYYHRPIHQSPTSRRSAVASVTQSGAKES